MKTNRRDFIKKVAVSSAGLMLASGSASFTFNNKSYPSKPGKDWNELRYSARNRKRRIIMNNDGNDIKAALSLPVNKENFLKQRSLSLAGSQVDSIFYCDGVFNYYTHQSDESELLTWDNEKARDYYNALFKQKTDPLKMTIDFGHKNNMEVFWSMRMNDTHDSGKNRDELFCNWKREHPEYLVGKRSDNFPYGNNRWSSVNYEIEEVREKVFRIINDVCSRYDIDGIELDFFRHPVLFKQQMTGDPVTQEQCDLLTEFVKKVYNLADELGRKRERPLLIAIRIPDSVGFCKAIGIDLLKWLKEDYVDIVSTGDYFKLEPWENLVAMGKKYNVPVYACFENRRIEKTDDPEGKTALPVWRGEALNAWKAGISGVYVFNRFKAEDQLFKELGDPAILEKLEYIDQTVYVNETYWSRPEVWLKDGDKFVTKEIRKF